jgi:hypothetical protein
MSNSKLAITWCQCGEQFRKLQFKKHQKEQGDMLHKERVSALVCSCHNEYSKDLNDGKFQISHFNCRQKKMTERSVQTLLKSIGEVLKVRSLGVEEKQRDDDVDLDSSIRKDAVEAAVKEVFGDVDFSSSSESGDDDTNNISEGEITSDSEAPLASSTPKEEEEEKIQEEVMQRPTVAGTSNERNMDSAGGIRKQTADWTHHLEAKAISREAAYLTLVDRSNVLKNENREMRDKMAKCEADMILNVTLRKEVEKWHSAFIEQQDENAKSTKKIAQLEAQIEKIRQINVDQHDTMERMEKQHVAEKAEMEKDFDEKNKKLGDSLGAVKQKLEMYSNLSSGIWQAHVGCYDGVGIDHPDVYNLMDHNTTMYCPQDDARGINCHHLTIKISDEGSISLRTSRMKKRKSRKLYEK